MASLSAPIPVITTPSSPLPEDQPVDNETPLIPLPDQPPPQPVITPSPRPSICKTSLTVPGAENGSGGAENVTLHTRRCSARLLSLNVREALNQLRQKEHKARVTAVVQRNANFYRRQRMCECASLMSALILFSIMSLYVVFAYGFYIGKREPFTLRQGGVPQKIKSQEVRHLYENFTKLKEFNLQGLRCKMSYLYVYIQNSKENFTYTIVRVSNKI